MRLTASHLRKLIRRLATWMTFGLMAGLLGFVVIAVGLNANRSGISPTERAAALQLVTFPGAYTQILTFLLQIGGLLAVIYGAAIAGSEWAWGTLKTAVARGESRSRYALTTFLAVAIITLLGIALALAVGVLGAIIGANLAGVSTSGIGDSKALGDLPNHFGRDVLAIIEQAGIGFAIATLFRSQLAGIGAGIGFFFGEQIASVFFPDVIRYLPFSVASAATRLATSPNQGLRHPLDPNVALVWVVGWLAAALIFAAVYTERAEITG